MQSRIDQQPTWAEQLQPWSHKESGAVLKGWMTPGCGRNNRPVIHFLHGTGLSGLTYWPFLKHFSGQYDLFINSIEGHGGSDDVSQGGFRDWNSCAERCRRALAYYQCDWHGVAVIGMGHSLGAILTLLMMHGAAQRFSQYVLLDPVLYPKTMIAALRLLNRTGLAKYLTVARKARRRRHRWPDREAALSSFRGRGVFKDWSDEALSCYVDHGLMTHADGEVQLYCSPWLEARLFSGYPRGLWSAIAELPPGTQIIHSLDTYPFIPPTVRKAEMTNANIRSSVAMGGHCFMQEYPRQSYDLIVDRLIRE